MLDGCRLSHGYRAPKIQPVCFTSYNLLGKLSWILLQYCETETEPPSSTNPGAAVRIMFQVTQIMIATVYVSCLSAVFVFKFVAFKLGFADTGMV